MIEAPAQNMTFPTLPDVLESVRTSAIESVSGGDIEAFAAAFANVFTSKPLESTQPDIALINLIAYAGAAFAVAEVCRSDGNDDQSGLFHVMGQDLLAQALDTLGAFMVMGIQINGVQVH